MRRGVDTNVLIYAHMPALPGHEAVRRYLLGELSRPETRLVITPLVLHELIHIITDGRRFDPAVSMSEAVALARLYLTRSNVDCLAIGEEVAIAALELLERYRLGRKRIADTLFAAALLVSGVHELITCNPDDFRVFEELSLTDPRTA